MPKIPITILFTSYCVFDLTKAKKLPFFIKVGSLFGYCEVQSLKMSVYSCLPHSCLPVTYSFRVRHCRVRNSFCDQHFLRNSYLQTRIYIKKEMFLSAFLHRCFIVIFFNYVYNPIFYTSLLEMIFEYKKHDGITTNI